MTNKLQEYSDEFDLRCIDRHEMGAEKYGPVKFLEIDSIEMAIEEVLDLGNYARYTYTKLRILQDYLAKAAETVDVTTEMLGKDSFTPSKGDE